jgi:hypothetical protein
VEAGTKSHIIFVVGKDAFILRSNSALQLEPEEFPAIAEKVKETSVSVMRLLTGKLLSVFGKRKHKITTAIATIGIVEPAYILNQTLRNLTSVPAMARPI